MSISLLKSSEKEPEVLPAPPVADFTKTAATLAPAPVQEKASETKPVPQEKPAALSEDKNGQRIYKGEVKAQNELGATVNARVILEAGMGEITPVGINWRNKSLYSEKKMAASSIGSDGKNTGFQAGVEFQPDKLGSTSATGLMKPLVAAGEALGLKGGFAGLQAFWQHESNVSQSKLTYIGRNTPYEFSYKVGKDGLKILATGEVEIGETLSRWVSGDANNKGATVRLTAEPLELARERKVQADGVKSGVSFKSTLKGTMFATDQLQIMANKTADLRVLPNGSSVNIHDAQGRKAYDAYAGGDASADGAVHFQQASGGASNVAVDVPSAGVGSVKAFGFNTTKEFFGGKTTVLVDKNNPDQIVSITKDPLIGDAEKYIPVQQLEAYLKQKAAQDPASFGDLSRINTQDLLDANQGRVVELSVESAPGVTQKIQAFSANDTVNTGFAALKDVQGVVRAPNLQEIATRADIELFFTQSSGTLAAAIAPSAIEADGSVKWKQLNLRAATDVVNGAVETVIEFPGDLAEGALNVASLAASGVGKAGEWLGEGAISLTKATGLDTTSVGKAVIEKSQQYDMDRSLAGWAVRELDQASASLNEANEKYGDDYYAVLGHKIENAFYAGNSKTGANDGYDAPRIQRDLTADFAEKQAKIQADLNADIKTPADAFEALDALKEQTNKLYAERLQEVAIDQRYAQAYPLNEVENAKLLPRLQVSESALPPESAQKPAVSAPVIAPPVMDQPAPATDHAREVRNGDSYWKFFIEDKADLPWQAYMDKVNALNPTRPASGILYEGDKVLLPVS